MRISVCQKMQGNYRSPTTVIYGKHVAKRYLNQKFQIKKAKLIKSF